MKKQNLMKTNRFLTKAAAMFAVVSLGFSVSCSEEATILNQEASEAVEDAITDAYFEDADDMANISMVTAPEAGGRMSAEENDDRIINDCVVVTITPGEGSTLENPFGTIEINFSANSSDGCTDPRGNVRKGKIVVTFEGRRLNLGSVAVITFVDYEINGINLEGTRTVTNISANLEVAPKFSISLVGGLVTWPDGTSATREHELVREWHRENLPINDYVLVWGTASGENRRGVGYEMAIDTDHPIRHNRLCPIPVSGIKTISTESHTIVVDFGDGDCDKLITITVDGESRTVEARR